MNYMRVILKTVFAIFLFFILSCEKDVDTNIQDNMPKSIDTIDISGVQGFLFNIPIHQDTFLIDKDHNIDFRIEIEGHIVDSAFLIIDNDYVVIRDTFLISTKSFYLSEGLHNISFLIRSIRSENGDTALLKSNSLLFNVVENLSYRFVYPTVDGGKLKLTWEEFDKNNTQRYIVERWLIDDKFNTKPREKKYYQTFEVENASFIDNYYVGEEAEYKITVLNNDGNTQDIWYYKKSNEQPDYYVSQNSSGGYNLHFTKTKYYNSFGQYYLTDGYNYNPKFIHSSNQLNDTVINIADAKFCGEGRFWLRYLPMQLPNDFSEDDWNIYGKYIYARYGTKSFKYDIISRLDDKNVVYIQNGVVYKRDLITNQIISSTINDPTRYQQVRNTPAGRFIYAKIKNYSESPVYFWSSDSLSYSPKFAFKLDFYTLPVSDNLIGIKNIESNITPSNLALYNVRNGNKIYTTPYVGSAKISSNGQYFFIHHGDLILCRNVNNDLEVIWEQKDRVENFSFFDFDPNNNEICYVWDEGELFSIRNTNDFSEINSYEFNVEGIISIDYYSQRIMGYIGDKALIFNLNSGKLEKEIPINHGDFFRFGTNTILVGNTIYNNLGLKYEFFID